MLILLISVLTFPVYADWKETLGNVWGSTEGIRETTTEKTKDYYYSLTDADIDQISAESANQEGKEHFKEVWTDVLDNLDDALVINS